MRRMSGAGWSSAAARKRKSGTPQGGVISPLLANIYFRRFLVAWETLGYGEKFQSRIVNYADDFVILTRRKAGEALDAARWIIGKIGLTLNEKKTRICTAGQDAFNFSGLHLRALVFEKRQAVSGQAAFGQEREESPGGNPRVDSVRSGLERSRDRGGSSNRVLCGYWNYFSVGTTGTLRWQMTRYVRESVRDWVLRKHARPRKRTGAKRSRMPAIWEKVQTATTLLIDVHKIPKHPSERKPVACLAK